MSAICGILNLDGAPVDPDVLCRMAEAAAYRGPDGIRYWIDGPVGLAHLALNSTPESLRETQPLIADGGALVLVADARVDNRLELIRDLGDVLREKDPTDADLILATYRKWGVECPVRIIGDFAFALWDGRLRRLLCARDALGIKTVHHTRIGNVFCVASEAKQILQHPAVPSRLDEVAVADFLTNNCYDEVRTMFLDVHKLPPAHRLLAGPERISLERFWDIDPGARTTYRDDRDYVDHFMSLFQRAVEDRLRTASPTIGILMSGGMDSTSVAAVARQHTMQRGFPKLVAYTWAYQQLESCDERQYSGAVAEKLAIEIEYVDAERFLATDVLLESPPDLESPFTAEESRLRHVLNLLKERGGRVLLTGHGGDSMVQGSGYVYTDRFCRGDLGALTDLHRHARVRGESFLRLLYLAIVRPLLPSRPMLALGRHTGRARARMIPRWLSDDFVRRTGIVARLQDSRQPRGFRERARRSRCEQVTALQSVGRAVYWLERQAAMGRIDVRHPFLDRRLAEYVVSIPPEQFIRPGIGKVLLRRALFGMLPAAVLERSDKTVFGPAVGFAVRQPQLKARAEELFKLPASANLGMINWEELRKAYRRLQTEFVADSVYGFLSTLALERWLREFGERLGLDGEWSPETSPIGSSQNTATSCADQASGERDE